MISREKGRCDPKEDKETEAIASFSVGTQDEENLLGLGPLGGLPRSPRHPYLHPRRRRRLQVSRRHPTKQRLKPSNR